MVGTVCLERKTEKIATGCEFYPRAYVRPAALRGYTLIGTNLSSMRQGVIVGAGVTAVRYAYRPCLETG
jgi:hypothetical protein